MNKKYQKQARQTNNLFNYFKKNQSQNKNNHEIVLKHDSKKRKCPKVADKHANQQQGSSFPAIVKKNSLSSFVRDVSIDQIFSKCPKLGDLSAKLEDVVTSQKHTVKKIIKKYLSSSNNSLWSVKYSPNDNSEIFNLKAAEKIQCWLNAFYEYKNKLWQVADNFLNNFQEEKFCQLKQTIRKNRWKLQALVVRGRAGIGKCAAIKAIAQEMHIDIQQCGNHFSQTKYLKQKSQSTQSESVKTAISRKQKLQKSSQMITKYLQPIEGEKKKQVRKCQLIHNIGSIYPQEEAGKFYAELNRCIQFSKIPFILTDVHQRLPYECSTYDQIEYEVGEAKIIEEVLWIIYLVQKTLNLNTSENIDKDSLFDEINKQISSIQFKELVPISTIRQICCLFNYKLDRILTFMEHHNLKNINICPLLMQKYTSSTSDTLLESILYIDFQDYHAVEKHEPSQAESFLQVTQKSSNQQTQQSQQAGKIKQIEWKQYKRMREINRASDSINNPIELQKIQKLQYQPLKNIIPIQVHQKIKKTLVTTINSEINKNFDKTKSTLRPSELQYLPMLKKRQYCRPKAKGEFYEQFFTQNQSLYVKTFGNLLKKQ